MSRDVSSLPEATAPINTFSPAAFTNLGNDTVPYILNEHANMTIQLNSEGTQLFSLGSSQKSDGTTSCKLYLPLSQSSRLESVKQLVRLANDGAVSYTHLTLPTIYSV